MTFNQDELKSLTIRDPLAYGITYVDLLDGKSWELTNHKWSVDIYQAVNPWKIERYPEGQARRLSIKKPTQVGMTQMGTVRLLHFADNWPVRIMFTLPRQIDTIDYSSTRLDPVLDLPYFKAKLGLPNSTHAKRLGDSFIYLAEMSVETRSLPIDMLLVDEVDLSNPDNVSTALNRLDASRWRLNYFFSTPTLSGYGIDALYNTSDMRVWVVTCPGCGKEQELNWEHNLRIIGAHNNPTKVYYGCASCDRELTSEVVQNGKWVAQRPDKTSEHIGFAVSQMMMKPAANLYDRFRDPQTKVHEFYRKTLGTPYEIGGGSLIRDDILATCFDEPYVAEAGYDGESTYFLGADQGNQLQVVVAKVEPNSRRSKVVHVEIIPTEQGFSRLAQLIDLYKVRRAVVDANPNRHSAIALTKKYPGRVLLADYVDQKETYKLKSTYSKDSKYLTNVTLNRTATLDDLIDAVKKGKWAIFGEPPGLPPDVELLIDHATAIKRDIETRRNQSGGETQVAVYRKLRADHLAHAWAYVNTAIDSKDGRNAKVVVIGDAQTEEEQPESSTTTTDKAISILAEVPLKQLEAWLVKTARQTEEPVTWPFPLSVKLQKLHDAGFPLLTITAAVLHLIKDKKHLT